MKTVLVLGLLFAAGCGKDNDGDSNEKNEKNNNSGNNSENPFAILPDPAGTMSRMLDS